MKIINKVTESEYELNYFEAVAEEFVEFSGDLLHGTPIEHHLEPDCHLNLINRSVCVTPGSVSKPGACM